MRSLFAVLCIAVFFLYMCQSEDTCLRLTKPIVVNLSPEIQSIQNMQHSIFSSSLNNTGSIATVVVYMGQMYYLSSGTVKASSHQEAIYPLGDLSKVVLATLMMKMRDEKKLNLDDSITNFLPNLSLKPSAVFTSNITLRQLSSSLSGIPGDVPCSYDCEDTMTQMLTKLQDVGLVQHGNTFPVESNLGQALLGYALAQSNGGSTIETLLHQKLVSVLGLSQTTYSPNSNQVETGFNGATEVNHPSTNSWLKPLRLYSSVKDLALLFSNLLSNNTILAKQTMRELFMPQFIHSDANNAVGLGFEFYRLVSPQVWIAKRGSIISGYNSYITVLPFMELAVISLASGTAPAAESVATYAMKILSQRVIDYSLTNQAKMRYPPNPLMYEGTFSSPTGEQITFTNGTNGIMMNGLFSLPIRLDYVRNNTFVMDRIMIEGGCERLFGTNIDGDVVHFISNGTMFNKIEIPGLTYGKHYINTLGTTSHIAFNSATKAAIAATTCTKFPPLADLPSTLPASIQNAINIVQQNFTKTYGNTQASAYVMIKYKNRILAEFGVGKTRNNTAPTNDTLYRIASVTKVFAAVAVLIAQEKGFISIDDPLSKYDTNFSYQSGRDFTNIPTFKQMIIHMGGVSRGTPCNPLNCTITYEELGTIVNKELQYNVIANYFPYYSNLGFTYAGRVLEKATNMSFESFCKKYILDPLNLSDTGFDIDANITSRLPIGRGFDMNTADPDSYISLALQAPSGQMYSSSNNLLSFFTCLTAAECSILSKDARKQLFLPTFLSPDGLFSVGLGSFEQFRDADSGIWFSSKSGSIFGFGAKPVTAPQLELTMTVLTSAQSPMVDMLSISSIPLIARALLQELKTAQQTSSTLPPNFRSLLGTYSGTLQRIQANHTITITQSNQNLLAVVDFTKLNLTSVTLRLYWTNSGLDFVAEAEDNACDLVSSFSLDNIRFKFVIQNSGRIDMQIPNFSYESSYTQLPSVFSGVTSRFKLLLWIFIVCVGLLL